MEMLILQSLQQMIDPSVQIPNDQIGTEENKKGILLRFTAALQAGSVDSDVAIQLLENLQKVTELKQNVKETNQPPAPTPNPPMNNNQPPPMNKPMPMNNPPVNPNNYGDHPINPTRNPNNYGGPPSMRNTNGYGEPPMNNPNMNPNNYGGPPSQRINVPHYGNVPNGPNNFGNGPNGPNNYGNGQPNYNGPVNNNSSWNMNYNGGYPPQNNFNNYNAYPNQPGQPFIPASLASSLLNIIDAPMFNDPIKMGKRNDKVIDSLYTDFPFQCPQCGLRFSLQTKMDDHLDWHFRQKRREKQKAKKGMSRSWFLDEGSWIASCTSQTNTGSDSEKENDMEEDEAEKEILVVARESQPNCDACDEVFEVFYDENAEEWLCKDASELDNRLYHEKCVEMKRRLSEKHLEISDTSHESNVAKPATEEPEQMDVETNENEQVETETNTEAKPTDDVVAEASDGTGDVALTLAPKTISVGMVTGKRNRGDDNTMLPDAKKAKN
eukprot:TRINITY_DN2546_c0_g1_i3.p1 TRINITY_DN2546_c0_g1~~TRINITY_DN2546_c0_g1_i3.p1  ORF type:complete len:495 (+),score=129.07 TRINITY_DN2546_c0_g1_i3:208-1692(+)